MSENNKLEIAKKVHAALVEDGVYGPYALGEDLWKEFDEAFIEYALCQRCKIKTATVRVESYTPTLLCDDCHPEFNEGYVVGGGSVPKSSRINDKEGEQ